MNASPPSPKPELERRRGGGHGQGFDWARWAPWALVTPGLLWLTLLFVLPLLGLLPLSLSERLDRFSLATTFTGRLSNYGVALERYSPILVRSFLYAGLSTLLAALIAYPLACWISFRGGRRKGLLLGLVVVPFFTSYLVRSIAWTTLLSDRGPVLALIGALGLAGWLERAGLLIDGRLLQTATAVIGGLTYNTLPFMVLPLVVSMDSIDPRLLDAARDLHAGWFGIVRRVILPLSLPGLSAGVVLSLIPSVGDVVNAQFLGGPNNRMIGNVIQNLVLVQRNGPGGAALALLLMALMGAAVLVQGRRHGSDGLTPP
jgi:spermidine/putrescine transport system permease protein